MNISAIGQDSHRFDTSAEGLKKPLILGGVIINNSRNHQEENGIPGLSANSDGDVVLHAITNAVSGITCVNILGAPADEMCRSGITDSSKYLEESLKYLRGKILHVSISIECLRPKITPVIPEMRQSIGRLLGIPESSVGITATTGEGLTDFGRGLGISVFCILTAEVKK
ncbi:MAG: 2-C-methyl-D-erythritol 2,4-cyclodiphosphate synthase [Lachnospiraceae bacterium]|jgi:2-C-methyl-D-erythritol 2,4-cyclodiphosphate synthase